MSAAAGPPPRPLLIGVGNRLRRDDGVAPRLIESLSTPLLARFDVHLLSGEPADLVEVLGRGERALVVDAVVSGARPGAIVEMDLARPEAAPPRTAISGHGRGLAEAVALAGALGRLPRLLRLFGVEIADSGYGEGLSPELTRALPRLTRRLSAAAAAILGPR